MADKRPAFGDRLLTDPQKVFEHNAWDHVQWDEAQEAEAQEAVNKNSQNVVPPELQEKYENEADKFWDVFYTKHQNKFFKDRQWLFTEFPELAPTFKLPVYTPEKSSDLLPGNLAESLGNAPEKAHPDCDTNTSCGEVTSDVEQAAKNVGGDSVISVEQDEAIVPNTDSSLSSVSFPGQSATFRVFEVGCGVGNTVFPVLQTNNDPGLFVYGCDLSTTAIDIVKEHPDYDVNRSHAFVCDVTNPDATLPFPPNSLDIITLIFVLSAIHPDKMQETINRLAGMLKPGGMILFRDYGRYDMVQLRFKEGKCLQDNFYVRSDGTRVYFFTQESLREMFTAAGLEEQQNAIDRRLQVNRGRQLKMYRIWIQCKYRRPSDIVHPSGATRGAECTQQGIESQPAETDYNAQSHDPVQV